MGPYGSGNFNYLGEKSDRREKLSEIVDSQKVGHHIWGPFGLVAFNVILRSFGAFAIFRNLGLVIRD